MSTNYISKNLLAIIGFILLLAALLVYYRIINLNDELLTIRAALVLSIAAILCCVKSFNQRDLAIRIASIIVVITGTVLTFISIYQLI